MTGADWDAPVRTATGREVRAVEIPWMRVRESVIHALDLDLGAGFAWCPGPIVDALLSDTTATVGAREGCPPVVVALHDRDRTWRLGPQNALDFAPATVTGSAVELLTWVIGRSRARPSGAATLALTCRLAGPAAGQVWLRALCGASLRVPPVATTTCR